MWTLEKWIYLVSDERAAQAFPGSVGAVVVSFDFVATRLSASWDLEAAPFPGNLMRMSAINEFLISNELSIRDNPCVSPDFCLNWPALRTKIQTGAELVRYPESRFETRAGEFSLVEDAEGNHAFLLEGNATDAGLLDRVDLGAGRAAFPATWDNLLRLKNAIQEHDPESTIFPTASGSLEYQSLGVGARFTTLHWPAVEWAMAELALSMTANQNSIPRELVYDVDAMLNGQLEGVPFPFIGADVPEGHQGQSVEGMSQGAVLSKLKTGFHRRKLAWGFNADHQPVGGKFDRREARLVEGCLLASYITFDLSPELSQTPKRDDPATWCAANVPADVLRIVRDRVAAVGLALDESAFTTLVAAVWPSVVKLQRRDRLYSDARKRAFTTPIGRSYFRELSIDELPGLTTPATLATMLALAEALDVRFHFVAPAFGFQKNFPFDDNRELEERISRAVAVAQKFGVAIGFHSGSGKSEENYRICGRLTGCRLEIKTSGRYTYEMGRALESSTDASDRELFRDWYRFTRELALSSAFSENPEERSMARRFIEHALEREGRPVDVFQNSKAAETALAALSPNVEHMFFFEYNFLFVLAAEGRADKAALGDHTPAGYRQRARFYRISPQGRLNYAKNVAEYLCFLAESTGMADSNRVKSARKKLAGYENYAALLADIAPKLPS